MAAEAEQKLNDEFQLRWVHQLGGPARCLAVYGDQGVMAATADGVCSWFASGADEGHVSLGGRRLHGTKPGLLFAMTPHRRPNELGEEPCFISGGADHKAVVFTCERRLGELTGHENSVNSVSQATDQCTDVATGSFDG